MKELLSSGLMNTIKPIRWRTSNPKRKTQMEYRLGENSLQSIVDRLDRFNRAATNREPDDTAAYCVPEEVGYFSIENAQTVVARVHDIEEKLIYCWREEERRESTITFHYCRVTLPKRQEDFIRAMYPERLSSKIQVRDGQLMFYKDNYRFVLEGYTHWKCECKFSGCNAFYDSAFL